MKSIICVVLVVLVVAYNLSASIIMAGVKHDPVNNGSCTLDDKMILHPGRHNDTRPGVTCGLILCYNDASVEILSCSIKEIFTPGFKYDGPVYEDQILHSYPICCELKVVPIPK